MFGAANTTLIEGIGGVLSDPSTLLQICQNNPVTALVVGTAMVVGIGMTVLPCGLVVKSKPPQATPQPQPESDEEPVPVIPPKKAPTLAIADLWGVYKPLSSLLPKTADTTAKHATYEGGYKSADGRGRVFNFHAAPMDPGSMDWTKQTTWDALKKRNTQEFIAVVEVKEGTTLPQEVVWSWKAEGKQRGSRSCDDDTQTGVRFAAIDGKTLTGDGSAGSCTAPVWDKTVTVQGNAVSKHVSAVKVICPNVGGDGLSIKAAFSQNVFDSCGGTGTPPSDETGVIRIWKRIDVEYRFMKDASLPVDGVPKYYEPAFVQMDVTGGTEIAKVAVLANNYQEAQTKMTEIAKAAIYPKKIGWFLLVACHSAYTPAVTAGDEATRYAASHCKVKVWKDSTADEELCLSTATEFAVGTNKTTANYKKHGELRGIVLDVAAPAAVPTKVRLFKSKANENEDEDFVDFQVASVHGYPEDNTRSIVIVEPEDYCTDFQPNTLIKERKLLLQYPNDTVFVKYGGQDSVSWLGRGGFSYPNAFSAKFIFSSARNLRGHSASETGPSGPVVLGQLFVFTTHNNDQKSQEITIVHEFCHAIGLYLPHKCGFVAPGNLGGYPTQHAHPRLSCCMNYRSTLLYREDYQAKANQLDPTDNTARAIQAWDKGTDVPDFCHRHVDAIQRSVFEKNTGIWTW